MTITTKYIYVSSLFISHLILYIDQDISSGWEPFYLISKHVFNSYYESYYEEDYKIFSETIVKINSVERGIFKHQGNVDTHIQNNGKLKPDRAYNEEVKVEIKYTNDCSCILNEVDM